MLGTIVVVGETRAATTVDTPLVSTPEENELPPTIGALRAGAFVAVIIGLVFVLGYGATRAKRSGNKPG
jgi:hypothetical protein